ncbi:TetR-like C-terminal domain-containing protein [Streptacidiphilus monticola]
MADLRTFLDATFTLAAKRPVVDVLLGLTSDAFADPALRADMRRYIAGRRALLHEVLERQQGWTVPVDTVVDMVFGAMWYRLMNEHAPVGHQLTREILDVTAALRS